MGLFSKKESALDYSIGPGYFPKVSTSNYTTLSPANLRHIHMYDMDLAAREQSSGKTKFVFSEITRIFNEGSISEIVMPLLDKYSFDFCKKVGIVEHDEHTFFRNLMVYGIVIAHLEDKSGFHIQGKVHPSIPYYFWQISQWHVKEYAHKFSHHIDFLGRVDQAIKGGFLMYGGALKPEELWSSI